MKKKAKTVSASESSVADPVRNWSDDPESDAYIAAEKLYPQIVKAFDNKEEQEKALEDFWDIFHAKPDDNAQYTGNSEGYIPAVKDAINARAKRALKQLFPNNHRYVDGLSSDPTRPPYTQLSLLDYYIRKTDLKSIVRSDLIAGDVTGQWNLAVDWSKSKRLITKLVKRNKIISEVDGEDVSDLEMEDPTDEEETTEEEEITEEGPELFDFATEDLAVIPPTCSDIQKAKAAVLRIRMSPEKVREMRDEGVFILPEGTDIDEFCKPQPSKDKRNPAKKQAKGAGIKTEGTYKYALIYVAYAKLDLGDKIDGKKVKSEAIIYYAGPQEIVGIIKNPLWSGKRPILSAAVERLEGSFFGISKIEPVKYLQWQLNDFWNMGMDSAQYSLNPIWAMDPLKNPNWASMVMGPAAVWPIAPGDVSQITQTQLWKDSAQLCDTIKRQIWESMDVNEAMMGKMPQGKKNGQLLGAMQQEQQVNITDHASRYEEVMLNPLMEMLFEFDQQYRTKDLMIETRGEIGYRATIEVIEPQQWDQRFFFRWSGTEYMMGMQRQQQQIAWMNVLKGIPPQLLNGRTLDVTPILEAGTENLFGPELAPKILIDQREKFTVPADIENEMLHNGFPIETHEADDDIQHLQEHMKAAGINGDPQGFYKVHMQAHMAQLMKKRQQQQAMQQPQGVPGGPGGAGPGVAGAPRPGALPAPGRPAQNPPGAIPPQSMADGSGGGHP